MSGPSISSWNASTAGAGLSAGFGGGGGGGATLAPLTASAPDTTCCMPPACACASATSSKRVTDASSRFRSDCKLLMPARMTMRVRCGVHSASSSSRARTAPGANNSDLY